MPILTHSKGHSPNCGKTDKYFSAESFASPSFAPSDFHLKSNKVHMLTDVYCILAHKMYHGTYVYEKLCTCTSRYVHM